jgi:hypothetical protein
MSSCSKDPTIVFLVATPTPISITKPTPDPTPFAKVIPTPVIPTPVYLTKPEKIRKFLEDAGMLNPINPEWATKKYAMDGDFTNNVNEFWTQIEASIGLDKEEVTTPEFEIKSRYAIEGIKANESRFSWIGTVLGPESGDRYAETFPMSKQDYDIYKSLVEDFQDFMTTISSYTGSINSVEYILDNQFGVNPKNITDNDKELLLDLMNSNSKTLTLDKYIELNGEIGNYLFGVEDFREDLYPQMQKTEKTEYIVANKIGYTESFNKFINPDNKLVYWLDVLMPGQSSVLQVQFENAITDYLNENKDLGLTAEMATEKILETWGLTPMGELKPYPDSGWINCLLCNSYDVNTTPKLWLDMVIRHFSG